MAGNLYLGPSSGLNGQPPGLVDNPGVGGMAGGAKWGGNPPSYNPTGNTLQSPGPSQQLPPNVLGPQAIRASGPSQGYDPQYLQNLATAFGGLFSGNQGSNVTNINPLGNLSEISPSSGIGGNAPTQGLPLTWLQKALNGGGFSYASPAQTTPQSNSVVPTIQKLGGGGNTPMYPLNS